jgi:TfoX/Sxy family transcriptional regulator of competence genes
MSVDPELAERVRNELMGEAGLAEKAMFGGMAFLLDGNMAIGITSSGELMVRVGAAGEDDALADPHARPFDMTGRPMKGWIIVARAGIETDAELNGWVRQGVEVARGLPAKR